MEAWVAANSGLLLLVGTLDGVLAVFLTLVFSAKVRANTWRALRFLLSPAFGLIKVIRSTSKHVARWCIDLWRRVTTPLEDRDSIVKLQSEWETERKKLRSEIAEFRALAEKRRQEVNTVAKERDGFRRQFKETKAQQSSGGSPAKAQPTNKRVENKVDLEIRKPANSLGRSSGGWVLRNWGPGTAYNVYIAAVDQDAQVKDPFTEKLSAQGEIVLYDGYSALPHRHSPLEPPKVRVSYENESGEKKIVFVQFPQNMHGL